MLSMQSPTRSRLLTEMEEFLLKQQKKVLKTVQCLVSLELFLLDWLWLFLVNLQCPTELLLERFCPFSDSEIIFCKHRAKLYFRGKHVLDLVFYAHIVAFMRMFIVFFFLLRNFAVSVNKMCSVHEALQLACKQQENVVFIEYLCICTVYIHSSI